MATNTVNGKRYIGATRYSLEKRKTSHLYHAARGSHGCRKFHPAIKKYGSDNFSWVVLVECADAADAFEVEGRLIAELAPEYNLSRGGERGAAGVKRTEAYCRNLSKIHKGKKRTQEDIAKQKATRQAYPTGCVKVLCLDDGIVYPSVRATSMAYGIHETHITGLLRSYKNFSATRSGKHFIYYTEPLTVEQRQALIAEKDKAAVNRRKRGRMPYKPLAPNGKDSIGRGLSGPRKNSRPVLCVTTGKTFESAAAAARYYDICKSTISTVCQANSNRKTAGGLVFQYLMKEAA
jgi:hypothetical protein